MNHEILWMVLHYFLAFYTVYAHFGYAFMHGQEWPNVIFLWERDNAKWRNKDGKEKDNVKMELKGGTLLPSNHFYIFDIIYKVNFNFMRF